MDKISDMLQSLNDSGDAGRMIEGVAEAVRGLEQENEALKARVAELEDNYL